MPWSTCKEKLRILSRSPSMPFWMTVHPSSSCRAAMHDRDAEMRLVLQTA